MSHVEEIAPGVTQVSNAIVNVFLIDGPGGTWTLVDAGMPGFAHTIKSAAEARYGTVSPSAIVLTHGHFDHIGSALPLADAWNIPIYAHRLELPFLTGQASYPPFDPTVGGFFPQLSRTFPEKGFDLSRRLRPLPSEGALPGLPDWEWHFTPGHAPGHVSLFRASDRTLVAGDTFITVNMDSFWDTVTHKTELVRPPSYATCDWQKARRSVEMLAGLAPFTVGTGHGLPMRGPKVAEQLKAFAENFTPPAHGRYIPTPAVTDESGVVSVPPPAPDLVPLVAAGAGVVAFAAFAFTRRKKG